MISYLNHPMFFVLALVGLFLGWNSPIAAQAPITTVKVDEVRSVTAIRNQPFIGRMVSKQSGPVAAQVAAAVLKFYVEVGDRVNQDQIIADLDNRDLTAQLLVSKATVTQSEAALERAEAEVKLARLQKNRLRKLRRTKSTSEAAYEDALQNEVIAIARVAEATAAVQLSKANLHLVQIDLDNTLIKAPYDGVVTAKMSEVGAYVQTGDPIVQLLSSSNLEIEVDVPFNRVQNLKHGTMVAVSLDESTQIKAKIRAVIPQENSLTRTRAVRLNPLLPESMKNLAANQSVTVLIPVGNGNKVLSVHKDAVIKRGNKSLVFIASEGKAVQKEITLGEAFSNRFQVNSGLEVGDLAVVRGNERLIPNALIQFAN